MACRESRLIMSDMLEEIGRLIKDATTQDVAGHREDLFDRYMAEPYTDEGMANPGGSQFLDSTIADAVDAIFPDIMDVFTSAEDIVEFSPVGAEDVAAAEQETKAVSYFFWSKNPGFENLSVWIKEALIQQNSYIWSGWVDKKRVTIDEYADQTPEEFLAIMGNIDGEYEFLEYEGFEVDDDTGDTDEDTANGLRFLSDGDKPAAISAKIRCVKTSKHYLIEPFPQEEFFITPRWNKIGLEGVPCCGRIHPDMEESDLLALGFSEESIKRAMGGDTDDEQKEARHNTSDSEEGEAEAKTATIYEAYMNLTVDGEKSLHCVWSYGDGSKVMEWDNGEEAIDEVSGVPISALTPYLVPHRHIGRSVAELVDDVQKVKTVLLRHVFDGIYKTNHQRPEYNPDDAGDDIYDDLLDPSAGAPIRNRSGVPVNWISPPPIFAAAMPVIEMMDGLQEKRTGATRYTQGLDAESLNKTASGIQQILNAGQKKTKLIARTIAETALRDLFLRMHRDLRAGPVKDVMMKMRGEWVTINPTTWRDRTDMEISVGMGRGDRDEVRTGLMAIGQLQRELMAAGSPMVTQREIYNTAAKAAKTFGIDHMDPYLIDPDTLVPPPPPPPPPPDPMMIAAETDQMKAQADAQRDQQKLELDARKAEMDHQYRMAQLQLQAGKVQADTTAKAEERDLKAEIALMDDDLARDQMAGVNTPL